MLFKGCSTLTRDPFGPSTYRVFETEDFRRRRLTRRRVLQAGLSSLSFACSSPPEVKVPEGPPPADEFLLRGGYVVTMDDELGDLPRGDVYIRQGVVIAVGSDIQAPDARVIDTSQSIVLPGFIDTHTHLWLTQMRGMFGGSRATRYFPLVKKLAPLFQPEDMLVGTLLGAAECLSAGITTVCAFCDNVRAPEYALAALEGLNEAGIRGRFLYGPHDDLPVAQPIDLRHVQQLQEGWARYANGGLLDLGIGWRAPKDEHDYTSRERARREYQIAKAAGLPIAVHASGDAAQAQLRFLIEEEVAGPQLQVVHATGATPEQLQRLNQAKISVALTPVTEHRVGYGLTTVSEYDRQLKHLSLGCDGNALAGSADMFTVMRLLHGVQTGASKDELSVSPRRILQLATIGGARALGLERHLGSIVPGKQADLLVLDTQRLNMAWNRQDDPSSLIVYSARPDNLTSVFVKGRPVVEKGQLAGLDSGKLIERAQASIWGIRQRAAGA